MSLETDETGLKLAEKRDDVRTLLLCRTTGSTAGTVLLANREFFNEQKTTPESYAGLQGKVALAAIKGDRTLVQLSEHFDVHPNQITTWKAQFEGGAVDVFGSSGGGMPATPAIDVKSLHAKIGELTCQSALNFDPVSAFKIDPSFRHAYAG